MENYVLSRYDEQTPEKCTTLSPSRCYEQILAWISKGFSLGKA